MAKEISISAQIASLMIICLRGSAVESPGRVSDCLMTGVQWSFSSSAPSGALIPFNQPQLGSRERGREREKARDRQRDLFIFVGDNATGAMRLLPRVRAAVNCKCRGHARLGTIYRRGIEGNENACTQFQLRVFLLLMFRILFLFFVFILLK